MPVQSNVSVASGGGGGGGVTSISAVSTAFTGDIDFTFTNGVVITNPGSNVLEFGLSPFTTIRSLKAFGSPALYGDAVIKAGTNVTLGQAGQEITVNAAWLPSSLEWVTNSAFERMKYVSNAAGASPGKHLDFWGQSSGTGTGGDVRLGGGDGSTKGRVRFGYISAGAFTDQMSIDPVSQSIWAGSFWQIQPRYFRSIGGIAATPWQFYTDLTAGTLAAAITATISAYRWVYGFSDTTRTPLEAEYNRVFVRGRLVQEEETASVVRVETLNVDVTTTSTSATLLSSYVPANSEMITVTVTLQHDNGTTNGRTVYTHTFRKSSGGTISATGVALDLSNTDKKLGHGVTIANASGTLEVRVVAASATSTKHRGQVCWEIASSA